MSLAPIALFTYNRPEHTARVVQSLLRNREAGESDLYIFSDGAKRDTDIPRVAEVRAYATRIKGFRSVQVFESECNLGLAKSVMRGVSQLCESRGKAIILEDDILVSDFFLDYMNGALDKYESDDRVISIGCYMFPIPGAMPESFFLRIPDCWGWGVWKRAWDLFESNGKRLLCELRQQGLEREFDFGAAYPYAQMLADQIEGKNDSWAIRWYATAFLLGKLTLYPGRSMTRNVGMDASGVHSGVTSMYDVSVSDRPVLLERIPIEENAEVRARITSFFQDTGAKSSVLNRLRGMIANIRQRIRSSQLL